MLNCGDPDPCVSSVAGSGPLQPQKDEVTEMSAEATRSSVYAPKLYVFTILCCQTFYRGTNTLTTIWFLFLLI